MPFHLVKLTSSEMTCATKGTLDCRKIKTFTQFYLIKKLVLGKVSHTVLKLQQRKKKNA